MKKINIYENNECISIQTPSIEHIDRIRQEHHLKVKNRVRRTDIFHGLLQRIPMYHR